jgi:hypothetical protein
LEEFILKKKTELIRKIDIVVIWAATKLIVSWGPEKARFMIMSQAFVAKFTYLFFGITSLSE